MTRSCNQTLAPSTSKADWDWRYRLALVLVAGAVYLSGPGHRPQGNLALLAGAFLRGEATIQPAGGVMELIPAREAGRFHCPYPPLPAILLAPFVLLFGEAARVATAARVVSAINVALFDACLARLPKNLNRPPLSAAAHLVIDACFALGTPVWHNAAMGGDWHLGLAVGMGCTLLALHEYLGARRPWVVGALVGLAMTARPTAAFAGSLFLAGYWSQSDVGRASRLARMLAGPLAAVLLLGLYNHARFGRFGDFGYERMILVDPGRHLMDAYGQFHAHFIPINFFWWFVAPPWPLKAEGFPWLGYDPRGMSLFLASPFLILAVVGAIKHRRVTLVRHAMIGILFTLAVLLCYFSTGFFQFGHRYALDYLPLLMVLVVVGAGNRAGVWLKILAALSIGINATAVLKTHPEPVTRLPTWLTPIEF